MWTQPVLTANGTIGINNFAVASGGGAASDAYKAFDSSASSYCNKMNSGAWLEFYSAVTLTISDILITSQGGLPSQGIFQISHDAGTTWEQCGTWTDTDGLGESAHVIFDDDSATGRYFRFLSQGKSLAKPNNNAGFCNVTITADEASGDFDFYANTERDIVHKSLLAESLKVWLPFDESTTKDLCWNGWTAYGSPTIQDTKLNLPGDSSYLAMTDGITLGGQNFTIRGKFNMDSATDAWGRLFEFNADGGSSRFELIRNNKNNYLIINGYQSWASSKFETSINTSVLNQSVDIEIDYAHDAGKLYVFYDGVLKLTVNVTFTRQQIQYVFLGASKYQSGRNFVGTIDEFQIFDGVALHTTNFTPPTDDDYAQAKADWDGRFSLIANTERKLTNRIFFNTYISFAGRYYCYGAIPASVLGGKSIFTVEVKLSTTSTYSNTHSYFWHTIIGLDIFATGAGEFGLAVNGGKLCFWGSRTDKSSYSALSDAAINDGQIHTVAVRSNADGSLDLFCDGEIVAHEDNANAYVSNSCTLLIACNQEGGQGIMAMKFYEARLWSRELADEEIFTTINGDEESLEAWYLPEKRNDIIPDVSGNSRNATLYGSPSVTVARELNFDYTANLERIIGFECSTEVAEGITTITDLDESKSKDGTAFYQTFQSKCFDLPPVPEIWIEFDIFCDGEHFWSAGNASSTNGICGIAANADGSLSFISNGETVKTVNNACEFGELQTIRLHMITGSSGGVIEAWTGPVLIYTYTGDVNHGDYFEDLFLQSDGEGTFFSSLFISNYSLDRDRYLELLFNTERKIYNGLFDFNTSASSSTQISRIIWSPPGGIYPPNFIIVTDTVRSKSGTAFSQTEIVKCFDLPPAYEIWIDFDVYFDGINRWRAGNAGAAGICGIVASVNGTLNYICNGEIVHTAADVCAIEKVQPVLLHMVSDCNIPELGIDSGYIECWINGEYIFKYSGDVNLGEDFEDIFLQCDGNGTVFSMMTFSTNRLDPRHYEDAPTIYFCMYRNGQVLSFPVRNYDSPITPALAIRYDEKNWYGKLVAPNDSNAGAIHLRHNNSDYALAIN